jgi:ribosomal-protein-alanine N-acetyltransferase
MSVIPRLLGRPREDRDLVIEPLHRRHLKAVLPIEAAAYPTSWSRSVFESEIEQVRDGTRYYVVARMGGEVAGYAGLWFVSDPDGDQAHITNIVVRESRRRAGIGRRLMLVLAAEAIRRGCVAWTLEVRASSEGARELYRQFGFVPAGIRKRYYDNVEDAIVMWCHELATPEYAARLERLT